MTVDRWRDRRVFGWARYLEVPDEREAALIREAAQAVIGGQSPFDVARDFNARGVVTVNGSRFYGQTVEYTLRRETNTEGDEPILTKEVFAAVLAWLNVPGRRSTAQHRSSYQRIGRGVGLLTGVATCGTCGGPVRRSGSTVNGEPVLGCKPHGRHGRHDGERHPTTLRNPAEARAREAVIDAFAQDRGISREDSEQQFEAMTLLSRRSLIARYLRVWVEMDSRGRAGHLRIERRAAHQTL